MSEDLENSSDDPYEEAARQLLEQAPCSPEYVPDPIELEDHVPVYILEPEHPEDLVPAEDEAPTPPLLPFFLSPCIRPPRTRAAMAQMRATTPSTYHSLLLSGTYTILSAGDKPGPTMSHRSRLQSVYTMETRCRDTNRGDDLPIEMFNMRVSNQVDVHSMRDSSILDRHHDAQKDHAAMRAEIESTSYSIRTEMRHHEVATTRLQMIFAFSISCVPRSRRLEQTALTHWRTLGSSS
ncbi:hypothetical protein Tco_0878852 [Tanacetum coccineum]|uniref:Uncharacterized protein n=1 Tax=Tanacetum coccineum TaxID=301880 RepID=A0ABQ5C2G1_9ASTR